MKGKVFESDPNLSPDFSKKAFHTNTETTQEPMEVNLSRPRDSQDTAYEMLLHIQKRKKIGKFWHMQLAEQMKTSLHMLCAVSSPYFFINSFVNLQKQLSFQFLLWRKTLYPNSYFLRKYT